MVHLQYLHLVAPCCSDLVDSDLRSSLIALIRHGVGGDQWQLQ